MEEIEGNVFLGWIIELDLIFDSCNVIALYEPWNWLFISIIIILWIIVNSQSVHGWNFLPIMPYLFYKYQTASGVVYNDNIIIAMHSMF